MPAVALAVRETQFLTVFRFGESHTGVASVLNTCGGITSILERSPGVMNRAVLGTWLRCYQFRGCAASTRCGGLFLNVIFF